MFPAQKDYNDFTPFLKGKTILVTGANRGVGYGMVKELVSHGANVIVACRNNGDQTVKDLKQIAKETNQKVEIKGFRIDLSDYESYLSFFKNLQLTAYIVSIQSCNCLHTFYTKQRGKSKT